MRKLAAFEMLLNYTQLSIHRPDRPDGPELWTEEDVAHGLIAQEGHVVFGVEDHNRLAAVTVWLAPDEATDEALPLLDVGADGLVASTPLGIDQPLSVAAGRYAIACEHRFDGDERLHVQIVLHPA